MWFKDLFAAPKRIRQLHDDFGKLKYLTDKLQRVTEIVDHQQDTTRVIRSDLESIRLILTELQKAENVNHYDLGIISDHLVKEHKANGKEANPHPRRTRIW